MAAGLLDAEGRSRLRDRRSRRAAIEVALLAIATAAALWLLSGDPRFGFFFDAADQCDLGTSDPRDVSVSLGLLGLRIVIPFALLVALYRSARDVPWLRWERRIVLICLGAVVVIAAGVIAAPASSTDCNVVSLSARSVATPSTAYQLQPGGDLVAVQSGHYVRIRGAGGVLLTFMGLFIVPASTVLSLVAVVLGALIRGGVWLAAMATSRRQRRGASA